VAAINAIATTQNANNALFAQTPVGPSQLDPQAIQYATVPLSHAQLLLLDNAGAGIQMVAGQGAGTMIEFLSATIDFVYGSAAFTIGAATTLTFFYTSASGKALSVAFSVTGFFDQTANQIANIKALATNTNGTSTAYLNVGLFLCLATADMTVGTGGTAIVKVAYRVLSGLS